MIFAELNRSSPATHGAAGGGLLQRCGAALAHYVCCACCAYTHACTRACTHARTQGRAFDPKMKEDPVNAASCGARGRGNARAAVRGCVVGQPVAPLGPAWAVLGSLWYRLPCHPAGTCAACLNTGAGVSAWGMLGGQLAAGASPRSRRCAVMMLLCYEAALAASAARTTLCYVTKKGGKKVKGSLIHLPI